MALAHQHDATLEMALAWQKNDRFACTKHHFLHFELAHAVKNILSKCLPKTKTVKKTLGFQHFILRMKKKMCRQLQGGESSDSLVFWI